jgi:hypothetical protein
MLPILLTALLCSCEFESYREYGIKPYDGALTFEEVTAKAEWKNRFDHAAVAYDDKLWIFGGYNPGEMKGDTYYEDVWNSSDGIAWEQVTEAAPWNGRRGHTVNVFDDGTGEAIYLIGGFTVNESSGYREYTNDVWKSTDGQNWTQIKERTYPPLDSMYDWFPRMNHVTLTVNTDSANYLYIIGGKTQLEKHAGRYADEYFNDVWRSTDGIDWEKLDNNDFGIRAGHAGAVDQETGRIYIHGGVHGVIFDTPDNASHPVENFYSLWSSPDGITWTAEYNEDELDASFIYRAEHQMLFSEGTLWVFPGMTESNVHYHFTRDYQLATWRYDNGSFSLDSEGSDIRARHSYPTVMFHDKIWFLGGFTSNLGQNNDVWTAEKN